jgi:hypothetical protein
VRRTVTLALALVVVLAGCGSDDDADHPDAAAYAVAPACPAPVVHDRSDLSVRGLNRIISTLDLPGWQAGDIGASSQLSDGRMVWLFGDTVRADDVAPRLVANSMLITSDECVAQLHAPDGGPVIPDVSADVVRWPMSVAVLRPLEEYADEATDAIVVMCARTRRGGGNLDYTFLGTSAAVFTVTANGVPELRHIMEVTPDDEAVDQVNWGAASVVGTKWFYVYGTRQTGHDFGRELYVGRAPVADPENRGTWEFWDGSRWQSDIDRAAQILPARGGVSQTLSVDRIDGTYVAVSKRDGDLGDFVYTWTSPTPVGPWTPNEGVAAPAGFDTGELRYAPVAHPEVPLSDGKLLITISRNTTDFAQLLANPEVGRPVFAEVDRP